MFQREARKELLVKNDRQENFSSIGLNLQDNLALI